MEVAYPVIIRISNSVQMSLIDTVHVSFLGDVQSEFYKKRV